ncbi:hypothetical protein B0H14DRAFT_2641488 [Mycena olivaceomarginata]|nr:hypothetical protein B0H14DRAFT_2641488 [Mycena olivaceomarginata]
MQSVPTNREEPSANTPRPSHSEATNSVLPRDAGGRPIPKLLPSWHAFVPVGGARSNTSQPGGDAIGNGPNPRGSRLHDPFPRTRFGLKKSEQGVHRLPATDYRVKYAEDPPYRELYKEAVYGMYTMMKAGLFSSVLTTFVAQTSQALSPDNTAVSNSILLELVSLQRAQANGTSFEAIPHADTSFTVALSDVWVNGLWFTSLMLSLTTALLAVLAKQWLRQYSSFIAGSAYERALIRQFRYASFDKWGVQSIIGLLPAILHLSVFLFMAGLVVFLYALNRIMATIMACIAGCLLATYLVTNALPVFAISCPYRTPLTSLLHTFVYGQGRAFGISCRRGIRFILEFAHTFLCNILQSVGLQREKYNGTETSSISEPSSPLKNTSLRQAERIHVAYQQSLLTDALSWLASTTSDSSAKIILAEALGLMDPPLNVESLWPVFAQQWWNMSFLPDTPCDEMQIGRLIRSTAGSPTRDTIGFVIEHYTEFDQLTVPMWMWLSIGIQAVMKEEISSGNFPGFRNVFLDVCKSNTYNMVERNKISVWFRQHLIPDGLQRSVDQTVIHPWTYSNRYIPVSLATFLAVIQGRWSFDNSYYRVDTSRSSLDNNVADPRHPSTSQHPSQPLPDTISHNSILPTHHPSLPSHPTASSVMQRPLSASVESAHSLQTLPELWWIQLFYLAKITQQMMVLKASFCMACLQLI